MARHSGQTPLRISCDRCGDGQPCGEDCLVGFVLAERDAEVVRFDGGQGAEGLDRDLRRAFETLQAAGLAPQVLAVGGRRHRRRAS